MVKTILGVALVGAVIGLIFGLVYLGFTGLVWLFFWCTNSLGLYTFTGSIWVAGLLVMVTVFILRSIFNRGSKD